MRKFYLVTRDLHLYLGLWLSPFVLVFAISVFFLVHAFVPWVPCESPGTRTVASLPVPPNVESLTGRQRIEALRPVLSAAGLQGEVGFIRYVPKEHRLVIPVMIPGRETTATIDLATRSATIAEHHTGLADALITLHKLPGPHLVNIRMNWFYMAVWRWLADATVYLLLFISISGIYLWYALRAERRAGIVLMGAGALSFFGMVYALIR